MDACVGHCADDNSSEDRISMRLRGMSTIIVLWEPKRSLQNAEQRCGNVNGQSEMTYFSDFHMLRG